MPDDLALVDTNVLSTPCTTKRPITRPAPAGYCKPVMAKCSLPSRLKSQAFSSQAALEALVAVTSSLTMLPMPADVTDRWMELVRRVPVRGRDIFDVQLVATMQGNGVNRIYTYNQRDFQSFSELELLTP